LDHLALPIVQFFQGVQSLPQFFPIQTRGKKKIENIKDFEL
jgi:hypothetical protein